MTADARLWDARLQSVCAGHCAHDWIEEIFDALDRLASGEVIDPEDPTAEAAPVDYRERLGRVYERVRAPADNLVPTGRLGMFNYNNSDHCLDMGRFIASEMGEGRRAGQIWAGLEERVRTYRIID